MKCLPYKKIRIATRQSNLAMWQAKHVGKQLQQHYPNLEIELIAIKTQGDILLDTPLAKIGGKGLFIKELETALRANRADIAVHSMKDVGVELAEPFVIAAILKRENPFDTFVSNNYDDFTQLPIGSVVGTSSLRRQMQISAYRPDLSIINLRGNVNTRLAKLDNGEYDAIILAAAGLIRLQLLSRITQLLPLELSLPAIGQGAIGIECCRDNEFLPYLALLNDLESAQCVQCERIINKYLQGNCQVPIAAHAQLQNEQLTLTARVGMPDGSKVIEWQQSAPRQQFQELGQQVAQQLIAKGARQILAQLK